MEGRAMGGESRTRLGQAQKPAPLLSYVLKDKRETLAVPPRTSTNYEFDIPCGANDIVAPVLPLTKSKPPLPGLRNLGQTCYINSVLQCLLHLPQLDKALGGSSAPPCTKFCSYCELVKLRHKMNSQGKAGSVAPHSFVDNLSALSSTLIFGQQQDAQEFLILLLDSLASASTLGCSQSRHTSKTCRQEDKTASWISKIFEGRTRSCVICSECGSASESVEPFRDLSLDMAQSVESALSRYTAAELLEGEAYECNSCREKVEAQKHLSIEEAPAVLILSLKRFTAALKDMRHVSYPEVLNISPFTSRKTQTAKYMLCGLIVHEGASKESGHYSSYVRGSDGEWAHMDDAFSSSTKLPTVLAQDAYVLFYARIAPSNPAPKSRSFCQAANFQRSQNVTEGKASSRVSSKLAESAPRNLSHLRKHGSSPGGMKDEPDIPKALPTSRGSRIRSALVAGTALVRRTLRRIFSFRSISFPPANVSAAPPLYSRDDRPIQSSTKTADGGAPYECTEACPSFNHAGISDIRNEMAILSPAFSVPLVKLSSAHYGPVMRRFAMEYKPAVKLRMHHLRHFASSSILDSSSVVAPIQHVRAEPVARRSKRSIKHERDVYTRETMPKRGHSSIVHKAEFGKWKKNKARKKAAYSRKSRADPSNPFARFSLRKCDLPSRYPPIQSTGPLRQRVAIF